MPAYAGGHEEDCPHMVVIVHQHRPEDYVRMFAGAITLEMSEFLISNQAKGSFCLSINTEWNQVFHFSDADTALLFKMKFT